MKTVNIRNKNTFDIRETSTGQTTSIRTVNGEIKNVVVNGTTCVITARKDNSNKNYVYDLERGTLKRMYSS